MKKHIISNEISKIANNLLEYIVALEEGRNFFIKSENLVDLISNPQTANNESNNFQNMIPALPGIDDGNCTLDDLRHKSKKRRVVRNWIPVIHLNQNNPKKLIRVQKPKKNRAPKPYDNLTVEFVFK